jgi:RNA polymerase sigma factor (sigma-70 family)
MAEDPASDAVGAGGGDRLDGDRRQDFAAFYASSYRAVLAATLAVVGSLPEAEDAVQEAMKDLLRAWDRVTSPYSYVRTAAVRRVIRARRRDRDVAGRAVTLLAGSATQDPGDALTVWEDRQWVTQFLQSLPPAQREVIALLVDDFSATEIAALLGKTEDAIRQNLYATRRRLGTRPGRRPDASLLVLDPVPPEVTP